MTANEAIQTPVVTFQCGGAAINDTSITYNNTSGNTWTAAYTANSSDTTGTVSYSIAFSDLAGNAGTAVTSGSGSVTFDKLEENYLDNQPGMGAEVESCGQNNYDCCRIDIVCEEYIKENRPYENFNNTINDRLIHPGRGYIPIHITSRGGCGGFDILNLISSYIYNDHLEFLYILINIILIWFIVNMVILVIVIVNKNLDIWIPLSTSES
mgnify:CR=1 FL=1